MLSSSPPATSETISNGSVEICISMLLLLLNTFLIFSNKILDLIFIILKSITLLFNNLRSVF
ncbi:hypothetical protein C1645_785981 [Glomus cerebriforme]|uniref:Uncharacterized protein n=1 Tax=Glomus cerebriforme TaxID=658196 RepID=A0A397SL88_9GLOM|nr:hypothetical protein C1645_785981 [Glomus cerebriforme]